MTTLPLAAAALLSTAAGASAPHAPSLESPAAPAAVRPVQDEPPAEAAPGEWGYLAGLYLFAADVGGTLSVGPNSGDFDASFSDLFDNLEFGGSLYFQAHQGDWGYQLDLTYMALASEVSPVPPATIEVKQDVLVVEADWLYRLEDTSIDFLAGLRYFDMSGSFNPQVGPGAKFDVDVLDPVVGLQWIHEFHPGWSAWLRGDVGGFDIGSKLTYQAYAAIDYRFKSGVSATLGYRALSWDLDKDGVKLDDLRFQGALLGVGYRF